MNKIIKITVPEEVRDMAQKANVERDARRDILTYIMANTDIKVSDERISQYQKEYDEKYFAFEKVKSQIEKEYVMPAAEGKASNWSLDYDSCAITITINE